MFSVSSLLSLYASLCTIFMFLLNAYHELVPYRLQSYLFSKLGHYFSWKKPQQSLVTLIIDDSWGGYKRNRLIRAASTYVSTKIGPNNKRIRIGKFNERNKIVTSLVDGEEVVDIFDGIKITWILVCKDRNNNDDDFSELDKHFEVTFEEKYRDKVVSEYFNHVLNILKETRKKDMKLELSSWFCNYWNAVEFSHPASFRTLAMDSDLKKVVMDDLDRFLGRKEYYKRIGKAWKRCYLLYGPPGTGKSSLVAAMANYLRFNIYCLELSNTFSDHQLRRCLLQIEENSIIVIEDIDCNSLPWETESESNEEESEDEYDDEEDWFSKKISAADVLRCMEGLWAKSEEQRIVVLTTNHKEALEDGRDVPGQIDMQIHMSYCTVQGFRVLALNYLGIKEHPFLEEIDELIQSSEVTPATLAEELLKNEDTDTALSQIINFLKKNKVENCAVDQA